MINLNKCALKMAGRPAAQSTIVPNANVMNLQAIRQEIRNFSTLISTLHSNQASMEWLACRRLLHNEMHCAICNVGCRLNAHADDVDGCRWKCPTCGAGKSVRHGSKKSPYAAASGDCHLLLVKRHAPKRYDA